MASNTPIATQADLDQITQWNWRGDSYAPPVVDALIHNQIQKHAISRPNAEAICAWDGSLTYEELDRLSSLLAHHLRNTYQLGPETFVPLCFQKSKWNVVSMLAVFKAGGACVPMDPKHPAERMQVIINLLGDKFAGVVLTCPPLMNKLSALEKPLLQVDQLLLDTIHNLTSGPFELPSFATSTAALVIFTSGSTGTPKGIVAEHRGYCSAAAYHGPAMAFNTETRAFQFAAHVFDVSLADILTTLIHGGCICIPSEEERMNDLTGTIRRLRANHLHITPTVACMIDPKDVVPGVEAIVLGGEPLSRQVVELWAEHTNLIQGYGPAEAGVDCTVRQHVKKDDAPNNLGCAVGSSIWIVDPQDPNKLVPVGAEGELLIEGPIVARGYLSNPEQTNKSFIWDPEWIKLTKITSGRRFYKTGDLGYYGKDGAIHIVGRTDFQVKLRGQRIELGEVEYHLQQSLGDSVRLAAAAVTPKGGEKLLAAFIDMGTGSDEADIEGDEDLLVTSTARLDEFRSTIAVVKAKLLQGLAPYMVPSVFLPLRKLPLSLSGKIERKLLVALAQSLTKEELVSFTTVGTSKDKEMIAPSTHQENVVCEVWKELLQIKDISADDDFFNLGGDSGKAMLLVSALRKRGYALTVINVMDNPVLTEQAAILKPTTDLVKVPPFSLVSESAEIRENFRQHAAIICGGIDPNLISDAYPATEMQERFLIGGYIGSPGNTWVKSAQETHAHFRHMIFTLPEINETYMGRLLTAWKTVAQRHDILRTRLVRFGEKIFQVVVDIDIPANASFIPLDVPNDRWGCPLVHVRTIIGSVFEICISHALYDGFTLHKIFQEVAMEASLKPSPVPAPAIKMSHWMQHLGNANKETALKFWSDDLQGADVKSVIPYDRLDRKTLQNETVKANVAVTGAPPSGGPNRATMIQVTAALVLAHRLGCPDVIFDCHLSGRTGSLPGVGDLVGPTLTSLPIRVRIGSDPKMSVSEILRQTQDLVNKSTEHEHVGWWTLAQMDEFRDLLRGAPLLNVLPGGPDLATELGLEHHRTVAHNEVPHVMMATLVDAETVQLLIASDSDCVPRKEIEQQLEQWKIVLQKVWNACAQETSALTVGDVFALLD